MKNNVSVDEFERWLNSEQEFKYASSRGKGTDKDLFTNQYGLIKVRDHNFIVYEGRNIETAVAVYNRL